MLCNNYGVVTVVVKGREEVRSCKCFKGREVNLIRHDNETLKYPLNMELDERETLIYHSIKAGINPIKVLDDLTSDS